MMDETMDLRDISELSRADAIRRTGLRPPNRPIRPTASEFKKLIDEGWRLWLDQHGYVLGYYPPTLWDRMTRLD